ncbi:MAG: carboxypeptidase regulatory-like domain-containing protein [Actinomycetota bacterium]|nr:carboxypeptidase regulatory-like domain-containing protein [Actinomycetota bacterium]
MRKSWMWGLAGVIALGSIPFNLSVAAADHGGADNDDRARAWSDAPPADLEVDLGAVTLDGGPTACGVQVDGDLWWKLPGKQYLSGEMTITVFGTTPDADPVIEILGAGDVVETCNDDFDPSTTNARVTFDADDQFIRIAAAAGSGGHGRIVFSWAPTSAVEGVVTDDVSGDALADVCVTATGADFSYFQGRTSVTGAYRLGPMAPSSYQLNFFDCATYGSRDRYVGEWWDNAREYEDIDLIDLGSDATFVADAGLARPASLTGVVTDFQTGGPLNEICVLASGTNEFNFGSGFTNMSGAYRIDGLAAGDYKVRFVDCAFNRAAEYADEWYHDAATEAAAQAVHVTGGGTANVDESLRVGGVLLGTVTMLGSPADFTFVDAYTAAGQFVGSTGVSPTGAYRLGGLPGGTYKVLFTAFRFGTSTSISEWWNDKPTLEAANTIDLPIGTTRSHVDAVLGGGTIVGAVTDTDGNSVGGDVCVRRAGPLSFPQPTSSTGGYRIGDVPSGTYTLFVDDCIAPDKYVNTNIPNVTVADGETKVVNIVLEPKTCLGRTPTVLGTSGNDRLRGTKGPDVIMGLAGDDFIDGLDGEDIICGGSGNDIIRGRGDLDQLFGGSGDDAIWGGDGADHIEGGLGNDILEGERNNDSIYGGAGDDTIYAGEGIDLMYGAEGTDKCKGDKKDTSLLCES